MTIQFCTRCLYPSNHPLGLTFDDDGVCSGCRVHEEKDTLDWDARFELLKERVAPYRNQSGSNFDCVVPVSGAKDSYFIVELIKNQLGLNPLLVTFNKHYNTRLGIQNLSYLRTQFDCDHLSLAPDPHVCRRIVKETLRLRGSMYWHCIAGYTSFPVRIAERFRIPLIIWGAHQGVDQVGMFSHLDEVEMSERYRLEHDLMSLDPSEIIDGPEGITSAEMEPFLYPKPEAIASIGIRGIYLNNYVRWDSKLQHEAMIDKFGYQTANQARTFNTYEDVDCFHYSGLHDEIKFRKWGYGKVTDHTCREIRLHRLDRASALGYVRQYQHNAAPDVQMFCDWSGINESDLWAMVDEHRDPKVWQKTPNGWQLNSNVFDTANEPIVPPTDERCGYMLAAPRDPNLTEDDYIITGRGWVGA